MMHARLACLFVLVLCAAPASAQVLPGASIVINGKAGTRFNVAPIAPSGVRTSDWLHALETIKTGATLDLRTNVDDGPSGPVSQALASPFVEPGNALVTYVKARYGLTDQQVALVFQTAGAVVSMSGQYVTAVTPTPGQIGAMTPGNNLSEVTDPLKSQAEIGALLADNNGSDIPDRDQFRQNLGIPSNIGDPRSFTPALGYSNAANAMIVAEADLTANWWDYLNNHFIPSQHDGGVNNGLYNQAADTSPNGFPNMSFWQMAQIANEKYWAWKSTGDENEKAKLVQQWAYIKFRYQQMGTGGLAGVNVTTLGGDGSADGTVGLSDDAAWKAQYLAQAYEVTGDNVALFALGNSIAATARRFADPAQTTFNYGTGPDGGAFAVGPYGLLYAQASDTGGTAAYGYISSSYEAGLAIAAEYFYRKTGNANYHIYAVRTYQWISQYLSTPAPTDSSKAAQHLVYAGLNLDPAQPATRLQPREANFGKPVRFHDSTFIGGLFMQAELGALLYQDGQGDILLSDIRNYANAIVSRGADGAPNGYLRSVNGLKVICNCRDPWTDAYGAPGFVYHALALPGVDPTGAVKQAFVDTAINIANTARRGNAYTADWSGPEGNGSAYSDYQSRYQASPGDEAGFQQLMTSADTVSMMRAGAIVDSWSHRR